MIFSEWYGAYYQTVAAILREACTHPVSTAELRRIVAQNAFGESVLNIEPALLEQRWQLLRHDGSTPVRHAPSMPLTNLQKRWLNAIASDPRIRLFDDHPPYFPEVEPLFTQDDIVVFDRYLDGDPYEDEAYIRVFRQILEAIRSRTALSIDSVNRNGKNMRRTLMPEYLEYSEKDDKFRLIGSGCRYSGVVNLARIVRCVPFKGEFMKSPGRKVQEENRTVELEVHDERNALERVLLHFAHFEKQAERTGEDSYRVSVVYDVKDETEMVIRVLSFGPMVKVTAPEHFVGLIKDRLVRQKNGGQQARTE